MQTFYCKNLRNALYCPFIISPWIVSRLLTLHLGDCLLVKAARIGFAALLPYSLVVGIQMVVGICLPTGFHMATRRPPNAGPWGSKWGPSSVTVVHDTNSPILCWLLTVSDL